MRLKLRLAALAASALMVVAYGAEAQDKKVRLQVAGAFPSTTGLLGPTQQYFVDTVRKVSGGSIDAKFFEPGALVPASQYFDAVANASLDAAWTVSGFFTGKDIAFAMYASVPFGPEAGEYMGWMNHGGGRKLYDDLHAKYNIVALPCGLIAPEASGWFRKEIKSPEDLKGLKMRFFGLGANVMQKLGVATQLLQAGEIFQALQLGTIDATEFSMPVMDLTLGFHQVAKHYYFPGWHQMSTINSLYVSKPKWAEMSDTQKEQNSRHLQLHHAASVHRRRVRAGQGPQGDPGQGCDAALLEQGHDRPAAQDLGRGRQGADGEESRVQEGLGELLGVPCRVQGLEGSRVPEGVIG